jgi:hypothetical protein
MPIVRKMEIAGVRGCVEIHVETAKEYDDVLDRRK